MTTNISSIEYNLLELYKNIGIDRPENHDKILEFVEQDVKETADHWIDTDGQVMWYYGDVAIAFRRFIESKQ